jgi:hypothetical protein
MKNDFPIHLVNNGTAVLLHNTHNGQAYIIDICDFEKMKTIVDELISKHRDGIPAFPVTRQRLLDFCSGPHRPDTDNDLVFAEHVFEYAIQVNERKLDPLFNVMRATCDSEKILLIEMFRQAAMDDEIERDNCNSFEERTRKGSFRKRREMFYQWFRSPHLKRSLKES